MAQPGVRNADWSRDETILLLDLYLRHPEAKARHPEVAALSKLLRDLARTDESPRAANFRNPVGIAMKLRNLAQEDPAFRRSGRAGLGHGNRLNAEVWASLADDPAALAREVERIRRRRATEDRSPHWQPSKGPAPSFGQYETQRLDGPTTVYILILEGTERWLCLPLVVQPGHDILKVGLSNDVERRVGELNAGLPRVLGLAWRPLWTAELRSGVEAFEIEQKALLAAHERGWSGAGEFVFAPANTLQELIRTLMGAVEGSTAGGPVG